MRTVQFEISDEDYARLKAAGSLSYIVTVRLTAGELQAVAAGPPPMSEHEFADRQKAIALLRQSQEACAKTPLSRLTEDDVIGIVNAYRQEEI